MPLVTIEIPDDTYSDILERATEEGFGSPEGYLSQFLESALKEPLEVADDFFDSDKINKIRTSRLSARNAAGLSPVEVVQKFEDYGDAWLADQPD